MAKSWSNQNNNKSGFRPQSRYYNESSSEQNRHGSRHSSVFQAKAVDDETTAYAINLLLKPVEMGIVAKNSQWEQKFDGQGAFNHYCGLLAPSKGLGYTLPDVWDGYFHITLVKFRTPLGGDQLEEVFSKFAPSLEDLPYIPDIVFRATSINKCSGRNRARGRQNIDFVVLPIDLHSDTKGFYEKIQPLLKKIEEQIKLNDWNVTSCNGLHVTIRKYSNTDFDLNKIKTQSFPLEFRCSHLEIKQTREQAIDRYRKTGNNSYKWWTGVTEINGKCSGCGTSVMSDSWEGFCLACGKYESIIPIWSTDGRNIYHHHQIQQQEHMQTNKTISELIQRTHLNDS